MLGGMTRTYRGLLVSLGMLVGCGPGGATSEGETETETGTGTGTATEPTGGAELVGCERLAGGGEVEWAVRCGGPTDEWVTGVAVDGAGATYVAMNLRIWEEDGSAPILFGATEVTPVDEYEFVVVKFDGAGQAVWAKHFTGAGLQEIGELRACGGGVVFEGYAAAGTLDLGGGPIAEGYFIASLDSDGAHRWSRGLPVSALDGEVSIDDMHCDPDGNLAITGQFRGEVDFGAGKLVADEVYDGFVARFDAKGTPQWSRGFGAVGAGSSTRGTGVVHSPQGGVIVAGMTDVPIDLGGGLFGLGGMTYLAAYDADGGYVWERALEGGPPYVNSLAIGPAGQLAIGATFIGPVSFGTAEYENFLPDAQNMLESLYDGLIGFLDPAGVPGGSLHFGGVDNDDIIALEYDGGGTLMLTGRVGETFTLQAHVDEVPGWTWTTQEFYSASTAVTREAVIVASSLSGELDLGLGVLAPRGRGDLIVAKIRR